MAIGCLRIGLDDTDAPGGLCTTWLGAVLARRLEAAGVPVRERRLVRLNPNAPFRTRGNAAIALHAEGDPELAFVMACSVGALANVGIADYLFHKDSFWITSAIAGVLVGVVWNYAVTAVFTWKPPKAG